MKSKVNKLDIDKLVPILTDLKNLSHVVDNAIVKNYVCDKLVKKNKAFDTSGLVKKQIMMLRWMRLMVKYLLLLA